jgi:hypothetical protein
MKPNTLRNYLVYTLIGLVLIAGGEIAIHIWKGNLPDSARVEEQVSQFNKTVLDAPKSIRPWDVSKTFYGYI